MNPSPASAPGAGGGLPVPSGPLVGRSAELDLLRSLLLDPEVRLVTLTGPPGVGKTRLALAAAATAGRELPDGAVFVDLTAVQDAGLVAAEVAAALGPETGALAADALPPTLADQALLLVLDNFEHVLPAGTALRELLTAYPLLTALVTSRERLHLRMERELPVHPLAVPGPAETADAGRLAATPAVALLLARVRAFDPDFAVTPANREALAEICVHLDGLPLALELAAPRLRLFSPADLLAHLRHRVGSLAADARDVPARHRTLTSALAWSHDLLGADERVMFRRLGVFVGGWTLAAAERVCAVPDPLATTASLIDKSLIRRTGGAGIARFGMLESLREFAAEQLDRAGETRAIRDRHAAWFAELAADIEQRVGTVDERAAIEDVGQDVGNLRQALQHHLAADRPASALPLAVALGWYAYTRGQLAEGEATLRRVMSAAARSAEVSDEALAGARLILGALALGSGDVLAAEEQLTRALRQGEAVGSLRLQAVGTAFLGHTARARGHVAEAVARYEEASRLHERSGNVAGVAWSRYDQGLLARRWRDPERAGGLLRESLVAFRELEYAWAVGCAAWALATLELRRGRTAEAAALLAEALAAFEATDDYRGVAQCLEGAAAVGSAYDAPATAARLLGAAAALRDRLGAPLPQEEQGATDAVRARLRHALGPEAADDGERAGHALSTATALALTHEVLARDVLAPGVLPGDVPDGKVRDDGDRQDVPRPRATAGGPDPLTPREAEVADLVRQGCTNRQIGRRLGISEKTTEVHVHNIIRKLGASSRAEIAAWVAGRARG